MIILRRLNACNNCIAGTWSGDIGDLLKYCPTLSETQSNIAEDPQK